MARSLTGPRMQSRLLMILSSEPRRTFTTAELCKGLRIDRASDLDQLAQATREACQRGGCPYPASVWGIGYRMEPVH